jgi:quinoprotein glucose dehydrogenase
MLKAMRGAFLVAALAALSGPVLAESAAWDHYGGDAGGRRYSPAAEITPENVARLTPAWTARTGHLALPKALVRRESAFRKVRSGFRKRTRDRSEI